MVAPARAVFRPSGFFLRIRNYQKVEMKIASFSRKYEISMKSVDQRQSSFYVLKHALFLRILSTHILSHTGYSHIKILSQIHWFEHLMKLLIRAKRRWWRVRLMTMKEISIVEDPALLVFSGLDAIEIFEKLVAKLFAIIWRDESLTWGTWDDYVSQCKICDWKLLALLAQDISPH